MYTTAAAILDETDTQIGTDLWININKTSPYKVSCNGCEGNSMQISSVASKQNK